MRITDAKVIVCSPGRNFVTLRIETRAGVVGLGDCAHHGVALLFYLRLRLGEQLFRGFLGTLSLLGLNLLLLHPSDLGMGVPAFKARMAWFAKQRHLFKHMIII